ncbi:MAG: hypothetical protein ACI94Y_003888 [Maribacter sp.]|jgi:hypothetical protein
MKVQQSLEHQKLIEKAEIFAGKIMTAFSDKIIYHDIRYAHRFTKRIKTIGESENLNDDDMCVALLAGWIHSSAYGDAKVSIDPETKGFSTNYDSLIDGYLDRFSLDNNLPEMAKEQMKTILKNINYPANITNKIEAVIFDSMNAEFAGKKGKKHLRLIYEEGLLHDINLGKKSFYDVAINILDQQQFHTDYGKKELEAKYLETIDSIKKEKKELEKRENVILKRELDITDNELKQLQKNLKSSKGRDDRGIQTLFRTTIKNHYTLNRMIDQKANIMITVNSIILSLVIGGVLGDEASENGFWYFLPVGILGAANLLSIIFAILSIRPENTHGKFTEEDIRNKKGNLLYFGNFHKMHPEDFEWGMLQLLNDGKYIYTSMIKDLYYLGITLGIKNKLIRLSLNIFIIGLVASTIASISTRCFIMDF